MLFIDGDGIDVALVPWPAGDAVRATLAVAGRPRVLMVAASAPPPEVRDRLEDWVRVPADHRDVEVRARRLARMARDAVFPACGAGAPVPTEVGGR